MSDVATSEAGITALAASALWRDEFVTAQDGLRLHARDYGPRTSERLAVVCLPGLTRNARDFHELAVRLSTDPRRPRRVLAIDSRGRGGSDYDRNWEHYSLPMETADVLDVVAAAGIEDACFVGTSRGGLITMLLTAVRPTVLSAAILNDIGPVVDGRGLLRIKNVLSSTRAPGTWADAVDALRRAYQPMFPALEAADWENYARKTYTDLNGRPTRDYDPKILKGLESIDINQPLATMWPQFDGFAGVPLMVIHGENSDILSPKTVALMRERRPDLETIEVEGAGHAPLLIEPVVLKRISDFVAAAENRRRTDTSPDVSRAG
jgi:pimeloyl-ACP methyl ester carboxylesterase